MSTIRLIVSIGTTVWGQNIASMIPTATAIETPDSDGEVALLPGSLGVLGGHRLVERRLGGPGGDGRRPS